MAALPIRHEEFTFIDFGSGKGKVLLLASELPFKAIVGIEFSKDLHQVAQQNLARYKSPTQACTRIDCLLLDATLYEVPLGPKVCFFFNPFHEPVMAQVVRRLDASLIAAPSPTFILYYRPALQHIFRDSKCFRELRVKQEYAIYQSTPGAI
jgi:SAM-dependent methyltransferase